MTTVTEDQGRQNIYAIEPPIEIMEVTETHNEKAEKLNGRLAMLGVMAAIGAYAVTGQAHSWDLVMAFRSGLEEKVADLMVELGVKYEYESTKVPYQIQHNYTPDFLLPSGIYLECKGYWDPEDRRKIKAVKEQHPEIDLRMVFQNPYNRISKKSKTTYAKYCEKLNIPWTSYANIPLEWFL